MHERASAILPEIISSLFSAPPSVRQSMVIANVLRTVDPQALRRPPGRDSQPCGRDSWPILGGVDVTLDETATSVRVTLRTHRNSCRSWSTQERPSLRNFWPAGMVKSDQIFFCWRQHEVREVRDFWRTVKSHGFFFYFWPAGMVKSDQNFFFLAGRLENHRRTCWKSMEFGEFHGEVL